MFHETNQYNIKKDKYKVKKVYKNKTSNKYIRQ